MFYTNVSFIIIFFLFAALIRVTPFRMRKYALIGASLFVIATWGWASLIIFVMTTLAGFLFADLLSKRQSVEQWRSRRIILILGIAFNLGLLILFKYREFLLGKHLAAILSGPLADVGIPLGISFYSFHIISYLVDIYRQNHRRASFSDFLFYLSFFPHVIAGPIVRGWQLMPQINMRRKFSRDLVFGTHLFITGIFLKTVCADNIGAVIDPYWNTPNPSLGAANHWIVAVYYYFQLYGDFAGYSLMACGMARMLGYRLPGNFRSPMRAVGFQDFWRRWHITLSRWLRDYLYIPLGGNRYGLMRTCINLLIVMALGGMWHGAAWTFLIWGLIHGSGLLFERLSGAYRARGWQIPIWWILSQAIILIAWVFFRSPSLAFAGEFVHEMFHWVSFSVIDTKLVWLMVYALPIIFHHFSPLLMRLVGPSRLMPVLGGLTGIMLITTIIIQSPPTVFIYFAF
jgi:alginate O-acetyltransferase complex protein AlgI